MRVAKVFSDEKDAEKKGSKAMPFNQMLYLFVENQLKGLSYDFTVTNNQIEDAQSVWSGLSGILYALPVFFTPYLWERALWITQAVISILADYTYINVRHPVHGIDRIIATSNTLRIFNLGWDLLWGNTILTYVGWMPIASLFIAHFYKMKKRRAMWIFWHFMWHLTGGLLVAYVTYRIRQNDVYAPASFGRRTDL